MAIMAGATQVTFTLQNEGRTTANPPVVFSRLNQDYSFSIWVRARNNFPAPLLILQGVDGSYIYLSHDGTNWILALRNGSTALPSITIAPISIDRWTAFSVVRNGVNITLRIGVESSPVDVNSFVTLVPGAFVSTADFNPNTDFNLITFTASPNLSICNFKYWNTFISDINELHYQVHRWDDGRNVVSQPKPIWASPLRTPGDLSNVANPYTSPFWAHGHGYTLINQPLVLQFDANEPGYLAVHQPCPTWLYPRTTVYPLTTNGPNPYALGTPPLIGPVNPGNTPITPTIYKATQFWDFLDRGSIPNSPNFTDITYYGFPFSSQVNVPQTSNWGLYKDENGVEVSDTSNPIFGFDNPTHGAKINGAINSGNIYLWKFSAQFGWVPVTPISPTSDAYVQHIFLYVTYIGFPTGTPHLSPEDLAGLFTIEPGQNVDLYNRGTILKIPDPTIRTAYIGE